MHKAYADTALAPWTKGGQKYFSFRLRGAREGESKASIKLRV